MRSSRVICCTCVILKFLAPAVVAPPAPTPPVIFPDFVDFNQIKLNSGDISRAAEVLGDFMVKEMVNNCYDFEPDADYPNLKPQTASLKNMISRKLKELKGQIATRGWYL